MSNDWKRRTEVDDFKAQQVVRPRAQVERQLKDAILTGKLTPGDKLPTETELAQQFGVSRPTVREALGGLASAGLIRKIPGVAGGSFVNSVNPDSLSQTLRESVGTILRLGTLHIDELTAVRRVLEIPSARMAAENRSEEDLEKLRSIVERQRTTTIDDPEIPNYDLSFHATIGQASGNRLLAAFIMAVHGATHPAEYLEVTDEVARKTVKQHIAIVAALEAGNPASAAEAMETHLDYVLRYSTDYPKNAGAHE
ncbi:FadR/GntR family transcriptional regulator [Amycolatopsis sp. NPDC051371]|uniref:FadR/GntR family transcriptional regulator n=1 Tax=Amycolatopsis sp. NPDC051371 TaxID=3155800 RepID=UPI0034248561